MSKDGTVTSLDEACALLLELEHMGRGEWLAARLARAVVALHAEKTAAAGAHHRAIADTREWAANVCERMVVGGCAWSEEQAIAGRALLDAAGNIRTLPMEPTR